MGGAGSHVLIIAPPFIGIIQARVIVPAIGDELSRGPRTSFHRARYLAFPYARERIALLMTRQFRSSVGRDFEPAIFMRASSWDRAPHASPSVIANFNRHPRGHIHVVQQLRAGSRVLARRGVRVL